MNRQLENELREELLDACRKCREFHYHPTYFLQMLNEMNVVEAARQLINSSSPSEGFTRLWENGQLGLSVEAHAIKPKYNDLFQPEEIERARQRLREYRYALNENETGPENENENGSNTVLEDLKYKKHG